MNSIKMSFAIPVKFQQMNPAIIPQYVSKWLDNYFFTETIRPWEQPKDFFQTWLMNDSIRLQLKSNYGPVKLRLFRCDGSKVDEITFDTLQQDSILTDWYIRQIELDVFDYEPGQYYLTIQAANSDPWVSEPQMFVERFDNSIYCEYSNNEKYQGIYFQAPYSPAIRMPGGIYYDTPGAKDTVYEDQTLDLEMVQSLPYDVYKYVIGTAAGVPPWLIKKANRILGCSDVKLDGRYFTKIDGATWAKSEQPNYPMKGWSIQLRERFNEDGVSAEDDVILTGNNSMVAVLENKGFGISDVLGGGFLETIKIN